MADPLTNPSSPSHSPRSKVVLHGFLVGLLLIALLAGQGWWMNTYQVQAAAAAGATAAGYALPARELAENGHTWITPESPVQYIGEQFVKTETEGGERYASQQAPGLAWITAPVYRFGGPRAALYVNPALALVTVLFLFLLCRRWMGGWFALLAALTYAAYPAANLATLDIDPHTAATAFLVLGLFFLDGWARRPGPWKALAAGLAFGLLPTILPGAMVCGIGVALLVMAKVWEEGPRWRQLFLLVLGAAIPLGFFAVHNQMALGTWRPAYSLYGIAPSSGPGVGLFLLLGLGGMVAMLWQRDIHLLGIGLLGIVLSVAAPHIHGDILSTPGLSLPTVPLLVLGAYWVLRQLALASPRVGWPATLAVTVLTVGLWLPVVVKETPGASRGRQLAATVAQAAEERLAKDSLLVCGPRLAAPLAFAGWKVANEDLLTGTTPATTTGQPAEAAAKKKPAGTNVLDEVFRWADGRKVYWIGRADDYERFQRATESKGQLVKVCEIQMPGDGQPVLVYEWRSEKPPTKPPTKTPTKTPETKPATETRKEK